MCTDWADVIDSMLGNTYCILLHGKMCVVRAVDGEKKFNDVGLSHGFIHFADPTTGECLGFSGAAWFVKNAKPV